MNYSPLQAAVFFPLTLLMAEIGFQFQVLALWTKSNGRHTRFSKIIPLVLCKDEGAFCPSIQFTSISHASEPRTKCLFFLFL